MSSSVYSVYVSVSGGAQQIDSQRLYVYQNFATVQLGGWQCFDDVEHLVKNYNSVGLEMPPNTDVKS